MGLFLSSLVQGIFGSQKEFRLLMLGLDNAGKTTILYKLKVKSSNTLRYKEADPLTTRLICWIPSRGSWEI